MINTLRHFKRGLIVLSAVASIGTMAFMAPLAWAATCTQGVWSSGTSGRCVSDIQTMLNIEGNYIRWANWSSLSTDGQFGPLTKGQVRAFQTYTSIQQDGIVGPQTWGKLCDKAIDVITGLNDRGSFKTADALQVTANDAGCGI